MRTRLVVALVAALFTLLGWSARARAATAEPTSGPAKPGTYAARHGAPYCDERAASAHAAEPSAPVVDGGEVSDGPVPDCSRAPSMSSAPAPHDDGDNLQRPTPTARSATLIPTLPNITPSVANTAPEWPDAIGAPREGVRRILEAPPRPVPWVR